MRKRTDTVLLAFSRGKDSIAAWLAVREHFHVVPFYMYMIANLEFEQESIRYYEKFFGTRIIQVPHPSLYRMLRNNVYQPPERTKLIRSFNLPQPNYEDICDLIREDEGLNRRDTYQAVGIRAADSPTRRTAINKYGTINHKAMKFYPVWDWNKARLRSEFYKHKVKLPIDYKWFGRSHDGLDYRFLSKLRQHAPADYNRILEWFPLAHLDIYRREQL